MLTSDEEVLLVHSMSGQFSDQQVDDLIIWATNVRVDSAIIDALLLGHIKVRISPEDGAYEFSITEQGIAHASSVASGKVT